MLLLCSLVTQIHAQTCPDLDFESYTAGPVTSSTALSGWTITRSSHAMTPGSNNCNPIGCCTLTPSQSAVIDVSTGTVDPGIGGTYTVYSVFGTSAAHPNAASSNTHLSVPFGGTKVFRMNFQGNSSVERISRTLTVTASNCLLKIAVIAVLDAGHDCCSGTGVYASVGTNTCPVFHASGGIAFPCPGSNKGMGLFNKGNGAPFTPTGTAIGFFNKWEIRTADLSAYIGQTVTVNVMASSCASGGHTGYAYLDMACSGFSLTGNGMSTQSSTICGVTDPTITAPPHYASYHWDGPLGFSADTAVIQATTPGVYTLTTHNGFTCTATTRTVQVVIGTQTVGIANTKSVTCAKNTVTLTAVGAVTQTWSTNSQGSSIVVSPTTTTTYSLSGYNSNGCPVSQQFTQTVLPCVSVGELDADNGVKLFPNPGHGDFTVELSNDSKGVLIIENLAGQLLYKKEVTAGKNDIDLNGFPSGIYLWSVVSGNDRIGGGRLSIDK
jgi:hypothetical protein